MLNIRTSIALVLATFTSSAYGFQSSSAPDASEATSWTRSDELLEQLQDETAPNVMVVAHRGCWFADAPENSLSAIQRCVAIGVDIIEIDIALTADGVPVLLHDETVDRTTDATGAVSDYSLSQLAVLRLRAGFGGDASELTNEGIPTLEEALAAAKDSFLINLDMKADAFDAAYEVVLALGVEDQILMKMGVLPDDPALHSAQFLGRTLFMPIIRECADQTGQVACVDSVSSIVPAYSPFNPIAYEVVYSTSEFLREGVVTMLAMGGRIWVNTLEPSHAAGHTDAMAIASPDAHWGQVIRDGASIIQTDRPALLLDYLQRQGLRSN